MFNKIKEEIKNYAEQYNILKKVYADKNVELKANYIGKLFDTEFAANHEQFNTAVHKLQAESKDKLTELFAQITESVRSSVTADLSADTIAELNLIKDFTLTEFEIKGYAKKFTGNAKALRILKGISEKNGIRFVYTSYEDILHMMKDLNQVVIAFINGYQGDYRTFGLYNDAGRYETTLAGDPINLAEDKYNDFLNPFIGSAANG